MVPLELNSSIEEPIGSKIRQKVSNSPGFIILKIQGCHWDIESGRIFSIGGVEVSFLETDHYIIMILELFGSMVQLISYRWN